MNNSSILFAKWHPCVYKGTILCIDCPDRICDMSEGRSALQEAFELGYKEGYREGYLIPHFFVRQLKKKLLKN